MQVKSSSNLTTEPTLAWIHIVLRGQQLILFSLLSIHPSTHFLSSLSLSLSPFWNPHNETNNIFFPKIWIVKMNLLIYLWGRDTDRDKQRDRVPICWFRSLKATVARAEPDWIQKLGTQSSSPMWVSRTQILGPSPPASQVQDSRKLGSEVESGHEPNTPILDAGTPSSILTTTPNAHLQDHTFSKKILQLYVYLPLFLDDLSIVIFLFSPQPTFPLSLNLIISFNRKVYISFINS